MKHTLSLVIAAVVIVVALALLSTKGKKAPAIPADSLHAPVTLQDVCVVCHAPGKKAPLKPGHPPKEQCLICHKVEKRQ